MEVAAGSRTEAETRVTALIGEAVRRPFDLAADPPLRVSVFTVAPDEHVLLSVFHHIAVDEVVDPAVRPRPRGRVRGPPGRSRAGVGRAARAVRGLHAVAAGPARRPGRPGKPLHAATRLLERRVVRHSAGDRRCRPTGRARRGRLTAAARS
ncbi:condensation domain-containing protein, partial [Yinghuangia aomiensis]